MMAYLSIVPWERHLAAKGRKGKSNIGIAQRRKGAKKGGKAKGKLWGRHSAAKGGKQGWVHAAASLRMKLRPTGATIAAEGKGRVVALLRRKTKTKIKGLCHATAQRTRRKD